MLAVYISICPVWLCIPDLWEVYTGQPKIDAIILRIIGFEDAPPVAIIRFGGTVTP